MGYEIITEFCYENLKTTQGYASRVSDSEEIRWTDILHAKGFNRKQTFSVLPRSHHYILE